MEIIMLASQAEDTITMRSVTTVSLSTFSDTTQTLNLSSVAETIIQLKSKLKKHKT